MRRFDEAAGDSYTANRYRGQHGQIAFITGTEEKQNDPPIQQPLSPTNRDSSPAPSYALAPVQDFQRRGRNPRDDQPIELDLASRQTVVPFLQGPTSKYLPYQAAAPSVTSSSHNVDGLVTLLYELRASLSSEQEQRKLLAAQLLELRASTQSNMADLRSSLLHVSDDVKGGEGRLLQLSGRMKEIEVQAAVEGRLQEKSDKVDERALLAQHASLQQLVHDLRSQLDEQGQRHREDLELVNREHQRALSALDQHTQDARQTLEERMAQQAEAFSSRLQVAMERLESAAPSKDELASLAARMAALQGECSAMELSLRDMREMAKAQGEDASSKGDWVRNLLTEQLQAQGRSVQEKIDTIEEGRRTLHQAHQRELTALREDTDRRINQLTGQSSQEAAAREELESRVQSVLKSTTSSLSSLFKETVASLTQAEPTSNPSSSTLSSLVDAHSDLESVLRAEIKTRMKAYNKQKARMDLLQGQLDGLKSLLGDESSEVRKVHEALKEEGKKVERMRERMKELKAKGEEGLEREHRLMVDVEKRVVGVEEMRRKVDGSFEDVKRRVEAIEELKRRVEQLEGEQRRPTGMDELRRELEDVKRGKLHAFEQLTDSLHSLKQQVQQQLADRERSAAAEQQQLAKSVHDDLSSVRAQVDELSSLKAKLDVLQRSADSAQRSLDERLLEMERARKADELTRKPLRDEELKGDVEAVKRDLRDKFDSVNERLRDLDRAYKEDERARKAAHDSDLRPELEALRRELREKLDAVNDRVRGLDKPVKDEDRRRPALDDELWGQVDGLKRELRDKVDAISERVRKTEQHEKAEQDEVEGVNRAVQRLRDEVRELERATATQLDELQQQLSKTRAAVKGAGTAAGNPTVAKEKRVDAASTADAEREEEEMLVSALEARSVLDDMLAAVERQQQQSVVDALRLHVNAQLHKVEERLDQCEGHVQRARAELASRTAQLAQAQPPIQSAAAPAAALQDVHALLASLEHRLQSAERQDGAWRDQLKAELLREARDKETSVKESLMDTSSRVDLLEEGSAKKEAYQQELSKRVLQQLTEVEVQLARLDGEWSSIKAEQQQQQRAQAANSWPPSARDHPSSAEAPARAPAMAAPTEHRASLAPCSLQELTLRMAELSDSLTELAAKQEEQAVRLSPPASSTPTAAAAIPALAAASRSRSARPSLAPELAAQLVYLQQSVTTQIGELAYQLQQQQKLIDSLRVPSSTGEAASSKLHTQTKRLTGEAVEHGSIGVLPLSARIAGGEGEPGKLEQLQATLGSQIADLSSRLSVAEQQRDRWQSELHAAIKAAQLEQQHMQQTIERLKDHVSTLHEQQPSRPAATEPRHAGLTASDSIPQASVTPRGPGAPAEGAVVRRESLDRTLAQVDHIHQKVTGQIGELSWRINEVAAHVSGQTTRYLPAIDEAAQGQWESALNHLQEATNTQIGELAWRLNELATRVEHVHMEAPNAQGAPLSLSVTAPISSPAVDASAAPMESSPTSSISHAELRNEVEFIRQTVANQIEELSWKLSQQRDQFESFRHQRWVSEPQPAPLVPTLQPASVHPARAESVSAPIPEDSARGASRVDHLEQAMIAQIGEISFRFNAQQEAHKAHVDGQLSQVARVQQHVQDALQRLQAKVENASAMPQVGSVQPVQRTDSGQDVPSSQLLSALDSRLADLQRQLTAQVAELTGRLNALPTAAQQPPASSLPVQPTLAPAGISVDEMQAAFTALQTRLQEQLSLALTELSGRIDSLSCPPASSASLSPPVPADLADRLVGTDDRVSQLAAHVQRLESAAEDERKVEEKEMEDIVARITTIYAKSKEEQAAILLDVSALRHSLQELRSAFAVRDQQFIALDEAMGEELRNVMDDIVRVEGEDKGERFLLQRRLREVELVLSKLHLRVTGKPVGSSPESLRSSLSERSPPPLHDSTASSYVPLNSYRAHRDRPRTKSGSRFSFLAPGGGVQALDEEGGADSGRSVSSARVGPPRDDDGRPDSQPSELAESSGSATRHHHAHISIDQGVEGSAGQHRSTTSLDDMMYDPMSPAILPVALAAAAGPPHIAAPAQPSHTSRSSQDASSAPTGSYSRQHGSDVPFVRKQSSRAFSQEFAYKPHTDAPSTPPHLAEAHEEPKPPQRRISSLLTGDVSFSADAKPSTAEPLAVTGSRVSPIAAVPPIDWKKGAAVVAKHPKGSASTSSAIVLGVKGRVSPVKFASARLQPSRYDNQLS